MSPFVSLEAVAAPLRRTNVDTDQIIRINRLIEFPRGELGPWCLEALRYTSDGAENPDFVPEQPRYRDRRILVAGENFGCGSSREHAVWSLMDWGVRCVIAPSFGDIFYSNSFQNGLLPVRLPLEEVERLLDELESSALPQIRVDLRECSVATPTGRVLHFEIEPERREALLEGLDDIGMTLRQIDRIKAFAQQDAAQRPWIYQQSEEPSLKKLMILAGDGVGPEILPQTRRVVQWFMRHRGLAAQLAEEPFGIAAWKMYGDLMPETVWEKISASDAILFGAIGSPEYDMIPPESRKADQLLRMRKEFDLFINFRPIKALDALSDASTLRPEVLANTDLVLVRELSGGMYFSEPRGVETLADGTRRAVNTVAYTSPEVERIARAAFDLARTRLGRVCSVDKANVLEFGALWRDSVQALRDREFPDIELSHMYVDNCAMQLVRNPRQFDVLVTENLFGDILSDCAAMVCGSIGMLPSASLSAPDGQGRRHALYEPIHGSAPDIAGQGIANPLGSILSFAMCLRYTFDAPQEAALLESAVGRVIVSGIRTRDIAKPGRAPVTTVEMGDAVLLELDRAREKTADALASETDA